MAEILEVLEDERVKDKRETERDYLAWVLSVLYLGAIQASTFSIQIPCWFKSDVLSHTEVQEMGS